MYFWRNSSRRNRHVHGHQSDTIMSAKNVLGRCFKRPHTQYNYKCKALNFGMDDENILLSFLVKLELDEQHSLRATGLQVAKNPYSDYDNFLGMEQWPQYIKTDSMLLNSELICRNILMCSLSVKCREAIKS